MKFTKHMSAFIGLASALLLAALLSFILGSLEQQRRLEAREVAQGFALRLLERFNETLGAVYLLSSSVDKYSGEVSHFDEHAADLARDFPLLRALELAPAGVIRHIYPMRGNEQALDHDLLADKSRNHAVHLSISNRKMAIAGPLELRQGGIGVVARYPLFKVAADGRSQFWGLSIAVIDFPLLLRAASDSELERLGYKYQICWQATADSPCQLLPGGREGSIDNAVTTKVGIAQTNWHLQVRPEHGWIKPIEYAFAFIFWLIGSLIMAWGANRLIRGQANAQAASLAGLSSPAT